MELIIIIFGGFLAAFVLAENFCSDSSNVNSICNWIQSLQSNSTYATPLNEVVAYGLPVLFILFLLFYFMG